MKIRLTRNTFVSGQSLSKGDEIEVTDAIGKQLLQIGKAVKVLDEPIAPIETAPETTPEAKPLVLEAEATIASGPPAKVHKTRKKGL